MRNGLRHQSCTAPARRWWPIQATGSGALAQPCPRAQRPTASVRARRSPRAGPSSATSSPTRTGVACRRRRARPTQDARAGPGDGLTSRGEPARDVEGLLLAEHGVDGPAQPGGQRAQRPRLAAPLLPGAAVGEPVPGEHALAGDGQSVAEGCDGVEEGVGGCGDGGAVGDDAVVVEEAQRQGSGVEIDAAVESVLSGVESHQGLRVRALVAGYFKYARCEEAMMSIQTL